jgi:hypothetical protein
LRNPGQGSGVASRLKSPLTHEHRTSMANY